MQPRACVHIPTVGAVQLLRGASPFGVIGIDGQCAAYLQVK